MDDLLTFNILYLVNIYIVKIIFYSLSSNFAIPIPGIDSRNFEFARDTFLYLNCNF